MKVLHLLVECKIRMNWGIENNANWIFDTAWKEDNAPWCNNGFKFFTLLRILCYNIISRLKTRRLRKTMTELEVGNHFSILLKHYCIKLLET